MGNYLLFNFNIGTVDRFLVRILRLKKLCLKENVYKRYNINALEEMKINVVKRTETLI